MSVRVLAALSLGAALAGCGYVGDPQPPSLQIPMPPTGLSVHQVGARIQGGFLAAAGTTDGVPLRTVDAVVKIGEREIPVAATPGMPVQFALDSAEWTGQTVAIAARLRGPTGRWSEWTPAIQRRIEPPVAAPSSFTAELTARGVELRWAPASAAVISRRVAGEAAFAALQEAAIPPALDATAALGMRYEYRLQARSGDALSEPVEDAAILVEDRFPPAVPTGLDAVAGLTSIELSWDLAGDADHAGWIVYRAAPGAEFARIAGPVALPSYSDRTPRAGVAYRYAISSVDSTGNESARSPAVEIVLP